ncbi:DUF6438 domain-containing protein [Brumimicrobium mesophilum]|uniref:DUF6438 domain-containing protein n=1 Tax=Brumimicrobium mesophilum TaxID=392717 RepID=UPI00131EBC3E|nr:DUF6438 domain-containing protein [Brumimicrobium mesophilum]
MKYWSIILLLTVIFSCAENELNSKDSKPTTFELLQGNWISEEIDSSRYSQAFSLNIEDSFFHLFSAISDSVLFKLKDSVITVYNSVRPEHLGNKQRFKILKINEEELELLNLSAKSKQFLKRIEYPFVDTLRCTKIKEKNNIEPIKIGFSSSGCFGTCPSMKLEIDSIGNVKFYGGVFSDLEGGYSGKIPTKTLNGILSQISYISLNTLQSEYTAPWTDDQTCYLYLETKDTIITVKSYGNYKQPHEISIVYGNLLDLYKRIELRRDSTIDSRFSFHKHLMMSYPIPPPPMLE